MGIFKFLKRAALSDSTSPVLKTVWSEEGIRIEFASALPEPTRDALLDALSEASPEESVLGAYLVQLIFDAQCVLRQDAASISWENIYQLQDSAEHAGAIQLLDLPPDGPLRPIIDSSGTMSGNDFQLEVVGWADGTKRVRIDRLIGAVATIEDKSQLLSAAAWRTASEIKTFSSHSPDGRSQNDNELAWARIRRSADKAGAVYANPYLETTLVLSPETLRLPQSKIDTPFGKVLTVTPTFDGAPDGWLTAFDGYNSVQPHYDFTRGAGRVRIVISEPVRKVLQVIKREMPGRRVAGLKAEKFLHNPFAFLGETAHDVLTADEFEEDRAAAGAVETIFSLIPRTENGRLATVDLLVTEHFANATSSTDCKVFNSPDELDDFLVVLEAALEGDRERLMWDEYDLNLDSHSAIQLEQGQQAAHLWRLQPADRINFDDIYELEGYSSRIEGIGPARPIYVPMFQKPKDDDEGEPGWIPSDLTPMVKVTLQEGQVLIPLTKDWVKTFDEAVTKAEREGDATVTNSSLPTAIGTPQARLLADSFKSMVDAQGRVKGDGIAKARDKKGPRQTLLVKTNFHGVDYAEERRTSLALPADWSAELPRCLLPSITLKQHQLYGIAWFQHLVSKAPTECRGALLADDMGLGKTVQLLSLLAWYYEQNPNSAPSIIFAPKSLLENWEGETQKFFNPSFPEVLVLYGDALKERKQPLGLIDAQLQAKGIVELLRPNWAGTAKVVLTTYEMLTSYEFSLAKQPFAFLICDEAQRIKTPGTLVTLAAKKLKADFRIACTGTPVENSLADLWCLFDLVQPGLLGALENFGKDYRRPIECDTEEQRDALKRLQLLIAPQTLRRTKASIAKELTNKFFAFTSEDGARLAFKRSLDENERLEIAMTEHQSILYKGGLKKLQDASTESNSRKRAQLSFGALHLMKAVCAEPYCLPGTKFLMDKSGLEAHLKNSPKLKWLLERLEEVKAAGDKAIVFTELREVQAALYYFLNKTFGIKAFIINGDQQGRQALINRFSASQGFDVIILSTLAAGAGLNVTAANHVFHFTRAWNPSKEAQATDRAFRIGQEKDVYVYCPTVVDSAFDTFEVRLDQILKRKAGLAGATLDNGELSAMLNGSGGDVSFKDLVDSNGTGEKVQKRYLTLDDVDRLDGEGFETLCCLLWNKLGFLASITQKRGGDGGIDVIALKGREGELLQCKSSKTSNIGWDAVKEVTAGAAGYQARHPGTRFKRVAVTNQMFTAGAVTHATENKVELITRRELEELLGRYPTTNHEFEEALQSWAL